MKNEPFVGRGGLCSPNLLQKIVKIEANLISAERHSFVQGWVATNWPGKRGCYMDYYVH